MLVSDGWSIGDAIFQSTKCFSVVSKLSKTYLATGRTLLLTLEEGDIVTGGAKKSPLELYLFFKSHTYSKVLRGY